MNAPWTPGPWRQVWSTNGHFMIGIAGQDGVGVTDSRFNLWSGDDAEAKANAHLIAAAPELAEALDCLLTTYVEMVNSGDCGFWDAEKQPEVIAARAALAKARGETP